MVESGFPVGHSMLDRQGHGPRAAACPDRNSRWRERCVVRDEHDHSVTKLTTAEIARGLLVPEATICATHHAGEGADSGQWYEVHHARRRGERPAREAAVLRVLYLVFNEGYTATSGARLHRVELSTEAIRLTRQLRAALPGEGEVAGLLALMLLTDARRAARTTPAGGLVPLPDQDRSRWDQALIAEGSALLTGTLPTSTVGPYQVQAAIAAVHDEARSATDTDWPQILGLYDILLTTAPGPMVTLNRIVAVAMVHGPEIGLQALDVAEPGLGGQHRIAAVRAHLLDLADHPEQAREQYELAARTALNLPERHYLESRARRTAR